MNYIVHVTFVSGVFVILAFNVYVHAHLEVGVQSQQRTCMRAVLFGVTWTLLPSAAADEWYHMDLNFSWD